MPFNIEPSVCNRCGQFNDQEGVGKPVCRRCDTTIPILPPFVEFPSITRLSREMIVTEKLDGTNASVTILEDGRVLAGSRTRWITPKEDNAGFAKWVEAHEDELRVGLGLGTHFGEWWGQGIQRGYGLTEKRFSLFNVSRWTDDVRPSCCGVVPTLHRGAFDSGAVDNLLWWLENRGSIAAPGFMKPEGVVVFHAPSGTLFKKTLDKNDGHKGEKKMFNALPTGFGKVYFTQFLRPDGRRNEVQIPRPAPVVAAADFLDARGYSLQCEVLQTGQVSLTVFSGELEEDVAIELCENGPDVLDAVDRLILGAASRVGQT